MLGCLPVSALLTSLAWRIFLLSRIQQSSYFKDLFLMSPFLYHMHFQTNILARWIFVLMEQIKADLLIFYAHLQHLLSHVYHATWDSHEWAAKNERNVSIIFYIYDNEIRWCHNLPFCGRARRGSRVRLPWEENARSRHQRLLKGKC